MSIRTLKTLAGVSIVLTLLHLAWMTDRLVAAESMWRPIDVVFMGVRVPFFPPLSSYLAAGFIFWLVYLWQCRR